MKVPYLPRLALLVAVMIGAGSCGEASDVGSVDTAGDRATIGLLRAAPSSRELETGFFSELRSAGWFPDRNLTVLGRPRDEVYPERTEAARALRRWVDEGTDLFVAFSSQGAMAVAEIAPATPTLFVSNDPSAIGLIENEQQPEGMLTGVTFRVPADRTLDLARRAVPDLETVGLLYAAGDATATVHRATIETAAEELALPMVAVGFGEETDVAAAIATMVDEGADAVVVSNSPAIVPLLDQIEAAARAERLPVIVNVSIMPAALISVFPDPEELGRQLGRQAARILGGSTPSAVPVEDPRRLKVTINLATATELGIVVPEELTREATEVIFP